MSPAVTAKWAKGTGGPAGDEAQNLVPEFASALGTPRGGGHGLNAEKAAGGQLVPTRYYVEDCENGTLKANGAGGLPRTDRQPLVVAHTLRSEGFDASEDGTGRGTPLTTYSIVPEGGQGADLRASRVDLSPAIARTDGERSTDRGLRVASAKGVRRLTPRECERLQGFPDDWTRVPDDAPDSRRYAACGDAVTVNVAEWIGRRLLQSS